MIISEIINNALLKYPEISRVEYGDNDAIVIGDYLYLTCHINVFNTDNCIIVRSNHDNISMASFYNEGGLSNMYNKITGNHSWNVSSNDFMIHGTGKTVAIIQISTLQIIKCYYFPNNRSYLEIHRSYDRVIIVDHSIHESYILNSWISDEFYQVIHGICKVYGDYLIAFPDDDYDASDSLSLIEVSSRTEYVLGNELYNRGIDYVEYSSCYFDTNTKTLYFKGFLSEKQYSITLDYIKQRYGKDNTNDDLPF